MGQPEAERHQDYVELRPFAPPQALHEAPINPDILQMNGLSPQTPQANLMLAQVALMAQKKEEGGDIPDGWYVGALDALDPRLETSFGGIRIDDLSLEPSEVLSRAEQWIRDSERTEWVPRGVMKLEAEEGALAAWGVLLVRAPEPSAQASPPGNSEALPQKPMPDASTKKERRWLRRKH